MTNLSGAWRLRLTRLSSGAENAKEGEILRGKPIWVSGMNLMSDAPEQVAHISAPIR